MSGFRIGRARAQHTYPNSTRGAGVKSLARNFAAGPKVGNDVAILETPTPVPWAIIDSLIAWNIATIYAIGDLVSFGGTTYISLQAANVGNSPPNAGDPPTAFWEQNTIVPITPRSTGVIVVEGVFQLENAAATIEQVFITISLGLASATFVADIPATSNVLVPILVEFIGEIPIGTRGDVLVEFTAVNAGTLEIIGGASRLEVREVIEATG